ncbi:MAG: hypothetical protein KJN64_01865 [Ignavibacteria bacterium]|nr:hypothetical protein [Ignavibacteria bacterium]NNL21508.1 hypothetical protein [Ignavibacteriaceae bacterium]
MKNTFKYFLLLIIILLFGACSKLNDNVPAAPEVNLHKEGILNPASKNFHGTLIKNLMWDMRGCQQCHAADYSGGIVESSCLTCHTQPEGPEACNTCHGDFSDPAKIAPPRDTEKNTSTDSVGVGAHVKHLYDNQIGKDIPCETCHKVPQQVYEAGHVDTELPAEIIFGDKAIINLGINSSYDATTATCSNTYCHGNWEFFRDSSANQFAYNSDRMIGNNQSVVWNVVDGTQAGCGSCHNLPPDGHSNAQISACGGCHSGIVDVNGEIVDSLRYKHINGEINVFGN